MPLPFCLTHPHLQSKNTGSRVVMCTDCVRMSVLECVLMFAPLGPWPGCIRIRKGIHLDLDLDTWIDLGQIHTGKPPPAVR